jgi:hypothetical protein
VNVERERWRGHFLVLLFSLSALVESAAMKAS